MFIQILAKKCCKINSHFWSADKLINQLQTTYYIYHLIPYNSRIIRNAKNGTPNNTHREQREHPQQQKKGNKRPTHNLEVLLLLYRAEAFFYLLFSFFFRYYLCFLGREKRVVERVQSKCVVGWWATTTRK